MTLALPNESLATRNIAGSINVLYNKEGFVVAHNATLTPVKPYDVAYELRKMDVERAAKVLSATQLRVSKLNNGEYTIARHGELKGGGAMGATVGFWLGKGVVYIGGHGAIVAAAAGSGPLGFFATFASLEAQFCAPIEAASNQAGLGAGMLLAVATGPV